MAEQREKLSDDEKLEYVYFILLVGRMNLDMYWHHLKLWKDEVLVHSMFISIPPGYSNFKVTFEQSVSTGYHCITSCSAEELYEDRRFTRSFFKTFLLMSRQLERKYGFRHFFRLIAKMLL